MSTTLIDPPGPLSQSRLWQLQREYYARQDVNAWGQGPVPSYITSNPLIARAYAQMILGYLRDLDADGTLDRAQPFYVVELGAGSGRFSYYLRRHLDAILARSAFRDLRVVLVMTDLTPGHIDQWRARAEFQPCTRTGNLDFASFDLEHDEIIHLDVGKTTLSPALPKNPMVFIANYVFDSIPQDLFHAENNHFEQLMISLHRGESPDPLIEFHREKITEFHYADPSLNDLLHGFKSKAPRTISIPVAALDCLKRLRSLSGDKMLLLCADKGYTAAPLASHPIFAHHGCISMMVNFAAIARWVRTHEGEEWHPATPPTALFTAAFAFGLKQKIETNLAYHQSLDRAGPDDLFALKLAAAQFKSDLPWDQALSYLRLTGFDSAIVSHVWPALQTQIKAATPSQIGALIEIIAQIDAWYFPNGESHDLAFDLGVMLLQLDQFAAAAVQFQKSLHRFGADAASLINLAMCHHRLAQPDEAQPFLTRAMQLDPANEMGIRLQHHINWARLIEPSATASF